MLTLVLTQGMAQTTAQNSPYSRFGMGDLISQDFANLRAMGGLGASYNSPYHLNYANPASHSFLSLTAFEIGVDGKYSKLTEGDASADVYSGSLSYIALGFALKNSINKRDEIKKSPFNMGMSLGLIPYSSVGYNLKSDIEQTDIGKVNYVYQGEGGQYKLFGGYGIRYKNIALGLNADYLFGKTTNQRQVILSDVENSFTDIFLDEMSVNGFLWTIGTQYEILLKKQQVENSRNFRDGSNDLRLTLGATIRPSVNLSTNNSKNYYRSNSLYAAVNPIFSQDSIFQQSEIEGNLKMPSKFSFGATIGEDFKWSLGFNYTLTNWNKYLNSVRPESLNSTFKLGVGGDVTPKYRDFTNYFNRISYRYGFYYETDPRVINGKQLQNYGITFGLGLPLKVTKLTPVSYCNWSLEIGKHGNPDLLSTTYVKTTLAFTLNDNTWFYKQKFN